VVIFLPRQISWCLADFCDQILQPVFKVRPLGRFRTVRRFVQIACLVCAAVCNLPNANAGFSFTPGHIYSTWTSGNTTNVIEYSADGTFLDSLTIPSLLQDDELRGIAFGPDGLLYAVMVHFADSGFQVLALDSTGTVHETYRMDGIYIFGGVLYGKIAIDDSGNMYVAGATALVHFTIGQPNSGMVLYPHDQVEDVKILPTGNLFVAWDYGVDEITSTGTFVRSIPLIGADWVNVAGMEYDPAIDKLFATELGYTGFDFQLMRINASTGVLENSVYFHYGSDLFLTQSNTLLVGSYTQPPGIFDENLISIGSLGTEQRVFVTQYAATGPTPTPTPTPSPTSTPTPCTGRCTPTPRPRPTPAPRPTP
jgi:hypothetical protein